MDENKFITLFIVLVATLCIILTFGELKEANEEIYQLVQNGYSIYMDGEELAVENMTRDEVDKCLKKGSVDIIDGDKRIIIESYKKVEISLETKVIRDKVILVIVIILIIIVIISGVFLFLLPILRR